MRKAALVVLSWCWLCSCASTEPPKALISESHQSQATRTAEPQGKVQIETTKAADIVNLLTLSRKAPVTIEVAMAYAGKDNFTATMVPGYQANQCLLQQKAAEAVLKVAQQAERLGYRLQLLDCYRPQRASAYFMQWVADTADQKTKAAYYPRVEKSDLNQAYIAAHSGHSRASTVDLTLLRKHSSGQWQAIDMGGAYDLFDPLSHSDSSAITVEQKANRLLLKDLMQQQGFTPYQLEWWHFTLQNETYPNTYFDFEVN